MLEEHLARELARAPAVPLPAGLLAAHIAATFTRVLEWWLVRAPQPGPGEAHDVFLALVAPVMAPGRIAAQNPRT